MDSRFFSHHLDTPITKEKKRSPKKRKKSNLSYIAQRRKTLRPGDRINHIGKYYSGLPYVEELSILQFVDLNKDLRFNISLELGKFLISARGKKTYWAEELLSTIFSIKKTKNSEYYYVTIQSKNIKNYDTALKKLFDVPSSSATTVVTPPALPFAQSTITFLSSETISLNPTLQSNSAEDEKKRMDTKASLAEEKKQLSPLSFWDTMANTLEKENEIRRQQNLASNYDENEVFNLSL